MQKLTPITDDMRVNANKFATEVNVPDKIHPADFIFQFLINNPVFKEKAHAVRYYFHDGMNSARKLNDLIKELRFDQTTKLKILEFASGYGCVSRHFSNHLANSETVSCDIHQDAIDFLQNELGKTAVLSHSIPELLELRSEFDVVFALSFFSHMPRLTWLRWLLALYARVKPNGYLIFTTQGLKTAKLYMGNPQIPADGFWFKPESEQGDLDKSEYGQTVVTEPFVRDQMRFLPNAKLLKYEESFWWTHQDLYVVQRAQ